MIGSRIPPHVWRELAFECYKNFKLAFWDCDVTFCTKRAPSIEINGENIPLTPYDRYREDTRYKAVEVLDEWRLVDTKKQAVVLVLTSASVLQDRIRYEQLVSEPNYHKQLVNKLQREVQIVPYHIAKSTSLDNQQLLAKLHYFSNCENNVYCVDLNSWRMELRKKPIILLDTIVLCKEKLSCH